MNPNRKIVVFDVETVSLPESDLIRSMPAFKAPSNYKDEEKIRASIESQKIDWLLEAALSPVTGQIAAIGYHTGGKPDIFLADGQTDESVLITGFYKALDTFNMQEFVGFNTKNFDLPFILRRSWKLGIPVPIGLRDGRYWDNRFVDLLETWQLGDRSQFISLDRLSRFFGLTGKTGDGSMFGKLEPQQQRDYLAKDLELTRALAERMLA